MILPPPTRRHLARLAGAVLLTSAGMIPAHAWADSPPAPPVQPTAVADRTDVAEGDFVKVSGSGWGDPGPLVSVQVCGNAGLSQAADCDLAGTVAGAVRSGGIFYTGLTIHRPPKDCPCVLLVSTAGRPDDVRLPIAIQGMVDAPLTSPVGLQRRVVISGVTIEGGGPWTSWFGAAPERDLVFSVTNTGDTVLHHPAVTLAWGRGSSPDGFIAPPDLGDLAPGQTTVSRVPIPMHALSFGTYRVTIDADPAGGESASGFAETTIVPWGLIVMALVLLQLVLLSIRNRYRRRHLPVDASAGAAGPSTDQTDPDADAPDETLDPVLQPAGAPSSDGPAVDTTARPERVDG